MAKNITINGASFSDVPSILIPLTDGSGNAEFIDKDEAGSSDVPFKYGGLNGTLVATYSEDFTLADTSFVIGSSASTSSTTIKTAVSNRYTTTTSPTIAYGDKDIVVVQTGCVEPTHDSTATNKALQLKYVIKYVTVFSKRKTTNTSGKTTRQGYSTSYYVNQYYSSSGTLSRTVANYGFYMTPSSPSINSTTASSTYVKCSSPVLYYRASSSYESTTNIKLVTACDYKWRIEVYTVDAFSTPVATANAELDDLLVNGL